MNTLKTVIHNRFRILSIISASIFLSIALLTVRLKITHSFFYLFLVWNLFLAIIPFAISTYLTRGIKRNKLYLIFTTAIWLLFLPNAPYILTDLWHLRLISNHIIWLDILIVSSFAASGLLLFYFSIIDMKKLWLAYINKKWQNLLVICTMFISSFGIYLGRFLRYNSWEIISNPFSLMNDVFDIILKPQTHLNAWLFTLSFGIFLSFGFWIFSNLKESDT